MNDTDLEDDFSDIEIPSPEVYVNDEPMEPKIRVRQFGFKEQINYASNNLSNCLPVPCTRAVGNNDDTHHDNKDSEIEHEQSKINEINDKIPKPNLIGKYYCSGFLYE